MPRLRCCWRVLGCAVICTAALLAGRDLGRTVPSQRTVAWWRPDAFSVQDARAGGPVEVPVRSKAGDLLKTATLGLNGTCLAYYSPPDVAVFFASVDHGERWLSLSARPKGTEKVASLYPCPRGVVMNIETHGRPSRVLWIDAVTAKTEPVSEAIRAEPSVSGEKLAVQRSDGRVLITQREAGERSHELLVGRCAVGREWHFSWQQHEMLVAKGHSIWRQSVSMANPARCFWTKSDIESFAVTTPAGCGWSVWMSWWGG